MDILIAANILDLHEPNVLELKGYLSRCIGYLQFLYKPLNFRQSDPRQLSPTFFEMLYLILIAFLAPCLTAWMMGHKTLPLPPGPKGLPLIGSPYELPNKYPWLEYAKWTKKYGAMFSFKVFGSPTIVINSARAATELLEKRSANYSDRPRMVRRFLIHSG